MCNLLSVGSEVVPCHVVSKDYLNPLVEFCGAAALLIPALGNDGGAPQALRALDGLVLTGAPSMVAPSWYHGPPLDMGMQTDLARDSTVIPCIRAALELDMPVLGICRGLQEFNVALGGTLRTEPSGQHAAALSNRAERYRPRHEVSVEGKGLLAAIAAAAGIETPARTLVNSLHRQVVDTLSPRLRVEARAPDGVIEAVSLAEHAFALAVQWHPEWYTKESALNAGILTSFGYACRAYRRRVQTDGMVNLQCASAS
jgi:putative glutamine amidotransferase